MPTKKATRASKESTLPASRTDRLAKYEAKRRFDVTPEPAPGGGQSSQGGVRAGKKTAFVVQKHDARRLHYDVRLEIDGAMASWAVPKGPSYDPTVRRLAVQTEDHPMEYNAFEGRIPDGEYGAGDVLLWDRGVYETVPPGQQRAMLEKGHLHVRFFGSKLVGDWHLIRTGDQDRKRGGDGAGRSGDGTSAARGVVNSDGTSAAGGVVNSKPQWLFFKAKDSHANRDYDVVAERPESIASGRVATRGPLRVGASEPGKSAKALHEAAGEPMLATATTAIANPSNWLFEIKYDGYRVMACKAADEVRLYTRRSHDWTDRFRPIADAVATLPARECVIDGEACAVDSAGKPSFHALQEWLGGNSKDAKIGYAAFDLLFLDGRDLRHERIEVRRELLEKLLEGNGSTTIRGSGQHVRQGRRGQTSKRAVGQPLSYSRAVSGDLPDLLRSAKERGLEGLVAKRKGSLYSAGRSTEWLKLRFDRRQDCAIAGWLPMAGTKDDVGALVLAVADQGKLVYAGRVGTGFDSRTRRDLAKRLAMDRIETPCIEEAPSAQAGGGFASWRRERNSKEVRWVHPKLVCECVFTEWTSDGSMRHPRWVGLREDKTPMECVRDAAGPAALDDSAPPRSAGASSHVSRAKLSNPSKVIFPRDGLTKQDVWDYYTAIAPSMLPHLAGRPLTLQRYPDGIDGEEWYQQNAPDKTPSFVRLVDVGPRHDNKKRIVCDSLDTLQWLANLAALTLHQWCSHVPPGAGAQSTRDDRALALPDYFVLDLDPGDGPWAHVIDVAHAVRTLLDALELDSYVKTSGKRGLHVVVPIAPGPTHDQATGFAEQVARAVAKVLPDVATVERMKDKRGGKLYVDYGQNGEGRTIVSPYTIRARDGAVVSTPIEWSEVTEKLDPTRFTMRSVLERVREKGDLFAGVLEGKQRLPQMARAGR
jgi:bifunctional non-homologous end joining protein LigD